MKLMAYSKALYSTWVYYGPDRTLFDAGESVSSIMGNKSFAVKRVFLSHGHTDHIAGLVGLINIRNNAMGDKAKPLTIYYPEDNFHVCELMNYLHRTNGRLSYPLEWTPLQSGRKVYVHGEEGERNSRYVEAFPTEHSSREVSLGYNVVEKRQRLKEKYRDLTQEEIREMAREEGRGNLMEAYEQIIFTFGGDSVPLNPKYIRGSERLYHDATFLEEEDRKEFKHSTLEEAVEAAKEAEIENELVAIHVSSRYRGEVQKYQKRLNERDDLPFEVKIIPPGRIFTRE